MLRIKELNRWLIAPLMAMLVVGATTSGVFADQSSSPSAAPSCSKERGRPSDKPIPPGQLTRRGVVGTYEGTTEDGNILVSTQLGLVEITPPVDFDLESLEEGVSRIATLLEKEPEPVGIVASGAATDTPFKTGSALKLKVIPTEATLSHDRGVVVTQGDDSIGVLGEDGDVENLELTGEGGDPIEDGTDVILLTQCSGVEATAEIRNIQRADKIAERLERFQAKFADDPEKAAKFADLAQKHLDKLEARLAQTAEKAPPGAKDKAAKALGKVRGQDDNGDEEEPLEDEGPPEDKGPPEGKGNGKDKS